MISQGANPDLTSKTFQFQKVIAERILKGEKMKIILSVVCPAMFAFVVLMNMTSCSGKSGPESQSIGTKPVSLQRSAQMIREFSDDDNLWKALDDTSRQTLKKSLLPPF